MRKSGLYKSVYDKNERLKRRDQNYSKNLEKLHQRPRYGLFSFKAGIDPTIETKKFENTNNFRNFGGNKKNFTTAKMKKGGLDGTLFSSPGYN